MNVPSVQECFYMGEKKGKGYFFPPWEALFVVLEKQTRLFFAVPAKNRKLNRFVLGRLHVSYSLHLKKKKKYIFIVVQSICGSGLVNQVYYSNRHVSFTSKEQKNDPEQSIAWKKLKKMNGPLRAWRTSEKKV